MPIDFYYVPGSAPCRSVHLTAKALGLELNMIHLDLMKGEHLSEDFVNLNPQHTVPTINDNGFVLWESRAIQCYLVGKYGKDDSLYPKDVKTRALIDQKLYFDLGTLYAAFAKYYYPVMFENQTFDADKMALCKTAFGFLETFLAPQCEAVTDPNAPVYIVGKNLTVADLSLLASVSTFVVIDFDITPYPSVERWYKGLAASAPGFDESWKFALMFKKLFDMLMSKKQ